MEVLHAKTFLEGLKVTFKNITINDHNVSSEYGNQSLPNLASAYFNSSK